MNSRFNNSNYSTRFKSKHLRKPKLLLLFFGLILFSCDFKLPKSSSQRSSFESVENSRNIYVMNQEFEGVIFAPDSASKSKEKGFMPTVDEIYEAELIFQNCLKSKKVDTNGVITDGSIIKATSMYSRQYFGRILTNGEKIIRFNCFLKSPKADPRWKTHEVGARDGGNAYFHVEINISTKDCLGFSVNGIA